MPDRLRALAQAVSEEADVDWTTASSTSDASERECIQQLRLVVAIGHTARRLATTWGPFELREQVGHGAFGTVYRAWDPTLNREVAIKLLHGETAGRAQDGVGLREARLMATVDHPNVVPVYGVDIHDGRAGIWMKFIHGSTLKELLVERGPFGADEAASIGRDVCQALAEIHRRGLLHSDIKAQNVMREVGGRTVVTDFGSGQFVAAAHDAPVKGSPAYLAPEIVARTPPTVQSDIYSVAVLLYHLVSEEFPVTASTWAELCENHAQGQPRYLRDARPDLPRWFLTAVDRGLAPDPDQRPASAAAMEALLAEGQRTRGRFTARAVMVTVVLATAPLAWVVTRPATDVPSIASVVIDRFENLTGSSQVDFLTTGLARQVGSRLSRLPGLRILVPSNVISAEAAGNMGARFGADAALRCQIRGTVQRLRLTCNLSRADASQGIWTDTSDHSIEDLVALESELSTRVAFALRGGQLTSEETRRVLGGRVAPEVLSLYLKGRHEWGLRTEESLNRAISLFATANRTAPDFGLAYSGLADAYSLLGAYGFASRTVAYTRALEAAERAVSLDSTSAESHFSLGYARKNKFDWRGAEASFRSGLELNPHSSTGHHWYSIYLAQVGRFSEALTEAKSAISLDPSSLAARTNLAAILMMARRYQDSINEWNACIELGSNKVNTYRALSKAYLYGGDFERAIEFAEGARRRVETAAADEELKADLAYVYASAGRRQEAVALTDELILRYRSAREPIAGSIAAAHTGLGDNDAAFTWLAAAVRDQDPELGYLLVDPKWDRLRPDSRFHHLLTSLGFDIR